jgi:hypothetical protein
MGIKHAAKCIDEAVEGMKFCVDLVKFVGCRHLLQTPSKTQSVQFFKSRV